MNASHVSWKNDIVDLSPEEVMNQQSSSYGNNDAAENFLLEALEDGSEIPAKEINSEGLELGFSTKVLWKAKEKIGVKSRKMGVKEGWCWYLPAKIIPQDYPKIPEDSQYI